MKTRASDPEAWFEKAEHDLLAIRNNLAGDRVPWDVVAFHAQQAAEKYLKGFLVARGTVVPRIHDLVALLGECCKHDVTLDTFKADSERLTRLGFASRYPDSPGEPSEADAREAVRLAETICAAVRARIPAGKSERADGTPPLPEA